MLYSPVVSIRVRDARITGRLCYLFTELCAMVHASHIRERSDAAQGPVSVDYLEAGGQRLEVER